MTRELIGLIPAAGIATRLGALPCSKELYPIGFKSTGGGTSQCKVASHYLVEKMQAAGVAKAYVVLREGKWDIPAYWGDGAKLDMHLAYLMLGPPFGVPFTLDQAYPFVRQAVVAFGFPDILFEPDDAFAKLLSCQSSADADIILGLFPAEQPHKVDMVDVDDSGRVRQIVIRPHETRLRHTWAIALWTPLFTQFLHDYLDARRQSAASQPELSVGDVIQAGIQQGVKTRAVQVSDKPYIDIGTPEDLAKAINRFA